VPVAVNAYFPPNQPSPARCHAVGRALRRAIESWDEDARVAVVASGGLSHFVVDEELDRGVLDALSSHDRDALAALPAWRLQSGSSEIRNWIVAAGVLEGLDMATVDYIPLYRTVAGTGVGAAFVQWSQPDAAAVAAGDAARRVGAR
jgi:aromatic ring-opening dioxygenase catalytic subunit (LigB family)